MLNDLDIARKSDLKNIDEIAGELNIPEKDLKRYGKHITKVSHKLLYELAEKKDGKLVLVTAISPTSAGEGKTTTSIGLAMALNKIGKKTTVALREPSLGPIMGIKGGAAGGGYSQVLPMEDINLHFTGDFHAISFAHNLLSASIDAFIKFGNKLGIDPSQVYWPRTMDMNDRALREIVVGLGGKPNGAPREDGFIITAASEIMAILCLAKDIEDLKSRLGKIIVARSFDGSFITASDLNVHGAMTAILKDAIDPNLVQTIEGTPAFVHGGPFANIAHGTNSIISTKLALKLSDCVVTEAGFGADLGAEKYLDFVSQVAEFSPSAVVLVASIRALKLNGGMNKKDVSMENLTALESGFANLKVHYENLKKYGTPVLVALNKFPSDTEFEMEKFEKLCSKSKIPFEISDVWAKGGAGGIELAERVSEMLDSTNSYAPIVSSNLKIEEKLEILTREIYRAKGYELEPAAVKKLRLIEKMGLGNLPLIVAKTQYSISDNEELLGAPSDYTFQVRDFSISAGAGFIVAVAGNIMLMPGLGKSFNAQKIDIDGDGNITGLF